MRKNFSSIIVNDYKRLVEICPLGKISTLQKATSFEPPQCK